MAKKTIIKPKRASETKIGTNQYFFLAFKNRQNSFKNPILFNYPKNILLSYIKIFSPL